MFEKFEMNLENSPGEGQDADPLFIERDEWYGFFVFDGLGGAGGGRLQLGNESISIARYAADTVRELVREYFTNLPSWENYEGLENHLKTRLREDSSLLEKPRTKVRSTSIRSLPTTIAGLLFERLDNDYIKIISIHAGDSRNYLLDPRAGLRQLTQDHVKVGLDAFDNLRQDAPMTNYVSADGRFELTFDEFVVDTQPKILFSCSDGVFDYVLTPMHFEGLMLEAISKSSSCAEIEEHLQVLLKELPTGDDASIIGCSLYPFNRDLFDNRRIELKRKFIDPIDHSITKCNKKKLKLRRLEEKSTEEMNQLWRDYKKQYYQKHINSTQ